MKVCRLLYVIGHSRDNGGEVAGRLNIETVFICLAQCRPVSILKHLAKAVSGPPLRSMAHFKRPSSGLPSRHLMVGNCEAGAAQEDQIKQLMLPYGPVTITAAAGDLTRRCFVTLPTEGAAAAAIAALDGTTPPGGNGPLVVKFAERREEVPAHDAAVQPQAPLVAVRHASECLVPGLSLHLDFVTSGEEAALVQLADAQPHWHLLAKRRVLHFGRVFDYESRGLGPPQHPIPAAAAAIAARVEALPGSVPIDQLTVNEYAPGVGISPHVETHSAFTGAIASLSLGGPAVMVLRREAAQHALLLPPRSLLVLAGEARYCWQHYIPHRKSDLVAAEQLGAAAQLVPRAARRVSFTFRQVRGHPCDCAHPQYCDSQLAQLEPTRMALQRMEAAQQQQQQHGQRQEQQEQQYKQREQQSGQQAAATAAETSAAPGSTGPKLSSSVDSANCSGQSQVDTPKPARGIQQPAVAHDQAQLPGGGEQDRQLAALESQFVHSIYNAIAPHFAATRFAVWPKVRAFLEALPPGALLADVGCGNGKYFGVRRDVYVLGSDRSEGLAKVAARRLRPPPAGEGLRADVAVADGMALPYRPASCDGVLCIAVLHHIASPSRRLALLAQLLHILRPGGRALVTVWATEQQNMRKVRSWQPVSLAAASVAAQGDAAENAALAAAAAPDPADVDAFVAQGSSLTAQDAGQHLAAEDGTAVASGDYFVPWHLPFHRAEAAAAAREAGHGGQHAASSSADAPAATAPRLDSQKGAVVYQRYYHLFGEGELDGLVQCLPGAKLVDSFYDKDNWCCVFERV